MYTGFALTQEQVLQLQLDRSRTPFGVWSWEWYQNEATDLKFVFLTKNIVFDKFPWLWRPKQMRHTKQNRAKSENRSTHNYWKSQIKIWKIQNSPEYIAVQAEPTTKTVYTNFQPNPSNNKDVRRVRL